MSTASPSGPLQGLHVLVIEDDYMQAEDIALCLVDAGAQVIGPTGTVDQAERMIDDNGFEAAVVDINLGDGPSYRCAEHLVRLGLPFMFVTGYGRADVPPEYRQITLLEKPFSSRALTDCLGVIAIRT